MWPVAIDDILTVDAYTCILFTVISSCVVALADCVLIVDQMLTDEEKTQAQQLQKANPDMIYLNDINILVSHTLSVPIYTVCQQCILLFTS